MIVKTILTDMYDENCHLFADETTKECGIVDPGLGANKIADTIDSLGFVPKYIILTHAHMDHVGSVVELSKKYNIPFYVSKVDEEYMEKDDFVYGNLPKASGYLKEGDTLTMGNHIVNVIETPGHTKGGLCFLVEDKLFTGDTLFRGSVGRTDFIGGSSSELLRSIKNKLFTLDENIEVYSGHGPMTTIGFEKKYNPFF